MTVQPNQAIDPSQFAGKWTLDGSGSAISFRASSLWGLMKVRGKFTRLRGEAIIEPNGSVRGQLVVDASSMDTANTKPDNHLRSDDFFNVAKHPEIVFQLSRIVPASDQHRLTVPLPIIGNSQPLQLTA